MADDQKQILEKMANSDDASREKYEENLDFATSLYIAFYAKTMWSDEELVTRLSKVLDAHFPHTRTVHHILQQLGRKGHEVLSKMNAAARQSPN